MKHELIFCILCAWIVTCCSSSGSSTGPDADFEPFIAPSPSSAADTFVAPAGQSLIWADEFDGEGINLDNWSYETEQNGTWSHSWNNEWQRYTDMTRADRMHRSMTGFSSFVRSRPMAATAGTHPHAL